MTDTRRNFGIKRQRSKEEAKSPAKILPGPDGCIDPGEMLEELREARTPGFARDFFVPQEETPKLHVPLGIDEHKVVELSIKPENTSASGTKEGEVVKLPTFRNRRTIPGTDAGVH